MAIDQEAVEASAAAAADKIMLKTALLLAFRASGLKSDDVRAMGRGLIPEIRRIPDLNDDPEVNQALREANERAVLRAFDSIADILASGESSWKRAND